MLNADKLCSDIQSAIEETVGPALKQAMFDSMPVQSSEAEEAATEYADTIIDIIAEPLAQRLGNAIHTYIKNISISGTIITVGSMVTQTAQIAPAPPATAGKVPNTLGIQ